MYIYLFLIWIEEHTWDKPCDKDQRRETKMSGQSGWGKLQSTIQNTLVRVESSGRDQAASWANQGGDRWPVVGVVCCRTVAWLDDGMMIRG